MSSTTNLRDAEDLSLVFRGCNSSLKIFGYCDASYISSGDSKSRLDGCVFMNYDSGDITFGRNSVTSAIISHSSTEAEIKALDELIREIMHILDMVEFVAGKYQEPVIIYIDNKSAISLMETLKVNNRVKHIYLRISFIREMINLRVIELHFVLTEFNVADVLTKSLDIETFIRLRDIMMNGHGGSNPCFEHLELPSTQYL